MPAASFSLLPADRDVIVRELQTLLRNGLHEPHAPETRAGSDGPDKPERSPAVPACDILNRSLGFFLTLTDQGGLLFRRGTAFPHTALRQALAESVQTSLSPLAPLAHPLASLSCGAPRLHSGALAFELDILGPFFPCGDPAGIDLSRHTVHLEARGRASLFPPRYPAAKGWSVRGTLEQLCRRLALPPGVWRDKNAVLSCCEFVTLYGIFPLETA